VQCLCRRFVRKNLLRDEESDSCLLCSWIVSDRSALVPILYVYSQHQLHIFAWKQCRVQKDLFFTSVLIFEHMNSFYIHKV
jgi:hypothetical protein